MFKQLNFTLSGMLTEKDYNSSGLSPLIQVQQPTFHKVFRQITVKEHLNILLPWDKEKVLMV